MLLSFFEYFVLVIRFNIVALVNNDLFVGLVVYFVEKFVMWSGCVINDIVICLESCFIKDEMLINVMIYWVIYFIVLLMRLYYEVMYSDDELRFVLR